VTGFVEKVLAVDRSLRAGGFRYSFGGAIALGYHVESPRATADIDVNITIDVDGAESVLRALPSNVRWAEADLRQIQRTGQVRLFWAETPVDLFFPQHALHDLVASRSVDVPFAGTTIPVISATDLTIFKALFDRPKDWIDIDAMAAYGSPDLGEARRWLTDLLGADDHRVARLEQIRVGHERS
jgi:hypothetical protein